MDKDFSFKKEGEFYSLQRLTYPRFKATFNYKTPLPEFIDIEMFDNCDAKDIAEALHEMDIYMKSVHKTLK